MLKQNKELINAIVSGDWLLALILIKLEENSYDN